MKPKLLSLKCNLRCGNDERSNAPPGLLAAVMQPTIQTSTNALGRNALSKPTIKLGAIRLGKTLNDEPLPDPWS